MIVIMIMLHVIHGASISLTEAFPEIIASFSLVWGVLVRLVVICVSVPVFAEVMSSRFYALVKAPLLCVAISRWRGIPAIVVLVLDGTGGRLGFMRIGFKCAGGCYAESKKGWCNTFVYVHRNRNLHVQGLEMITHRFALPCQRLPGE